MTPPLWQHQQAELASHGHVPYRGIFWEQGTGKTRLALETAALLRARGDIDATLVITKNGLHRMWANDECPLYLPEAQPYYYDGGRASNVEHRTLMADALAADFPLLAMSYDSFMTDHGLKVADQMAKRRRLLLVVDEASAIKNAGAQRTKRLVPWAKKAPFRRALTGTPITKNPFNLYPIIKFLDEGYWKLHGFSEYSIFKHYFGQWEEHINKLVGKRYERLAEDAEGRPIYRHLDELTKLVQPITTRVLKDDVLDLPPKSYTKRYFRLTERQRRVYDTLKRETVAFLENGEAIDGQLAVVRLTRFSQITSNYAPVDAQLSLVPVKKDDTLRTIDDENPRMTALFDVLEETEGPCIIWARWVRDIEAIAAKLGSRCVAYYGDVSDDDREVAKNKFQAGAVQFFVGNPQAAGFGLTLTAAHTVVYYNNSFNLEDRLQSEDRAHRGGLQHPVLYVDIVAEDTVDDYILKTLRNNLEVAAVVNGDRLKEWI